MKKLLLYACCFLLLQSCVDPVESEPETEYEPVLMSRNDLDKSIKLLPPQALKNTGKIYYRYPLLFINEKYEGVHIFNNADPTNPTNIGFIQIKGNVDIAIKDHVIYADNTVDLVALHYDGNTVEVLERNKNVFPEVVPPDFGWIPDAYQPENRHANTVIVKWIKK